MTTVQAPRGKIKTQNRIPCYKCNATMRIESITDRRALGGIYHEAICDKCGYVDELYRAKGQAEVKICQKTEAYHIDPIPGKPGRLKVWKNGPNGQYGYPVFIDGKKIVQWCGCQGYAEGGYCKHADRAFFKTQYLWDGWIRVWEDQVAS